MAHHGAQDVAYVHAAGPVSGRIIYQPRVPALRPFAELVRGALATEPDFRPVAIGAPHGFVTREGEYAALVMVSGQLGDLPAHVELGFVFLDDAYTRVVGTTSNAETFAEMALAVRTLVWHDAYFLGSRPRRTLYDRPRGWHGVANGSITDWYPPTYPTVNAVLRVWPAMPRERVGEDWWRLALGVERGFVPPRAPTKIGSDHGLRGESFSLNHTPSDEPPVWRDVAVLRDGIYGYLLRLDQIGSASDDLRNVLMTMVRTTRPIPSGHTQMEPNCLFDHWA
jgi:hypothetical protein